MLPFARSSIRLLEYRSVVCRNNLTPFPSAYRFLRSSQLSATNSPSKRKPLDETLPKELPADDFRLLRSISSNLEAGKVEDAYVLFETLGDRSISQDPTSWKDEDILNDLLCQVLENSTHVGVEEVKRRALKIIKLLRSSRLRTKSSSYSLLLGVIQDCPHQDDLGSHLLKSIEEYSPLIPFDFEMICEYLYDKNEMEQFITVYEKSKQTVSKQCNSNILNKVATYISTHRGKDGLAKFIENDIIGTKSNITSHMCALQIDYLMEEYTEESKQELYEIYKNFKANSSKPKSILFEKMMQFYFKRSMTTEIRNYFKEAKKYGEDSLETFIIMAKAYSTLPDPSAIERLIEDYQKRQNDIQILLPLINSLIIAYGRASRYKEMINVLSRFEEEGGVPDEVTFSVIMRRLVSGHLTESAVTIFEAMKKLGIPLKASSYKPFIINLAKEHKLIKAMEVYQEMKKDVTPPYDSSIGTALLEALLRTETTPEQVFALYKELKDSQVEIQPSISGLIEDLDFAAELAK